MLAKPLAACTYLSSIVFELYDAYEVTTKSVRYGPCSFAVAESSMWNALSAPLRNDELSAMSFRRQLKTELYIRACYSH